jgi:hypothetical protein
MRGGRQDAESGISERVHCHVGTCEDGSEPKRLLIKASGRFHIRRVQDEGSEVRFASGSSGESNGIVNSNG